MKQVLFFILMINAAFTVFAQNGVIREFTGEVQLKPAGSPEFVPAKTGGEIAPDTVVSTGFKSTAVIAIGSSTIIVQPLTRLTLAEIQTSSGTENLNMKLGTGRVRVDVKPPAGAKANFTVQSPSATASVRGTVFEFDTRSLKVIEGTVMFQGSNGAAVPIPASHESFVSGEGKAADPAGVAAESLRPPPPSGADSSGETPKHAGNAEFSIELEFKD